MAKPFPTDNPFLRGYYGPVNTEADAVVEDHLVVTRPSGVSAEQNVSQPDDPVLVDDSPAPSVDERTRLRPCRDRIVDNDQVGSLEQIVAELAAVRCKGPDAEHRHLVTHGEPPPAPRAVLPMVSARGDRSLVE